MALVRMVLGCSAFASAILCVEAGAASPVSAQLVIPLAGTHVIGDAIPLHFRFQNNTTEPLAFMWEGCCRFNGRLTVTKDGRVIPPTPPGQALAHMFAKAERLEPGVPRDFDTRLSDWVTLTESGTYELKGRYQGVLEFQRPQVQRGLTLWRDTAETGPITVSVLTVADYLQQRGERAARRGLALALSGPAKLPPLEPVSLQLQFHNSAAREQTLRWPDAFQLWIVSDRGRRLGLGEMPVEAACEELALAPGARITREVQLGSDKFEGEPFGDYQVFLDLRAEGSERPRVPSNPIPLRWELTRADVIALLNQAAGGHRTGARNAPLKLLRVHVAEIQATLAVLVADPAHALSVEAVPLARELAIAGRLKPLRPKPGLFQLKISPRPAPATGWSIADPQVLAALSPAAGAGAGPDALRTLLAVRRHLGWEVGVALKASADTRLVAVAAAARQLSAFRGELAAEPRADVSLDTNRLSAIEFPAAPAPVNLVLRIAPGRMAMARRESSGPPSGRALIQPGDPGDAAFTLVDAGGLEAFLQSEGLASTKVLLLVQPDLSWGELLRQIAPLARRGLVMEAIVGGGDSSAPWNQKPKP
jgi:hypothetical protein